MTLSDLFKNEYAEPVIGGVAGWHPGDDAITDPGLRHGRAFTQRADLISRDFQRGRCAKDRRSAQFVACFDGLDPQDSSGNDKRRSGLWRDRDGRAENLCTNRAEPIEN